MAPEKKAGSPQRKTQVDKSSETQVDKSTVDQLVDLFVYAPVGMIYEYSEVLPQLVKRGKSQVQLAKVFGQMAANQTPDSTDAVTGQVLGFAADTVARGITEFGALIGLAPEKPSEDGAKPATRAQARPKTQAKPKAQGRSKAQTRPKAQASSTATKTSPSARLPIAGYDKLKAKDIVPLLGDLTAQQRNRIKAHEAASRNRKTILAKLDRLDA